MKTFKIQIAISNTINPIAIVEAEHAQEALDLFVDGPDGNLIEVDQEDINNIYHEDDIAYLGNYGKPCYLGNVLVIEE